MIKRILITVLVVAVAVGCYYGYKEYKWRQTPQYAASKFIEALETDPNKAYRWISTDLVKDREDYWLKYFATFTGKELVAVAGGSSLQDPLNTYPDSTKKPFRMSYFVNENGAVGARMQVVFVHHDGDWKVGELFDVPNNKSLQ